MNISKNKGDRIKNEYSPVFWKLAKHYLGREMVLELIKIETFTWRDFKKYVKKVLIDYINNEIEEYFDSLPFLRIERESYDDPKKTDSRFTRKRKRILKK